VRTKLKTIVSPLSRGLLLAALLSLAVPSHSSAQPKPAAVTLPADRSTPLPARQPDAARLRELASQREFRYVEVAEEESGWWDAFWMRIWGWLARLLSTPAGRVSSDYLMYGLAVVALVFAVLKFLQVDLTRVLGRAPRRVGLEYDTANEDIHAVDFRARIAEAEAAGDFRLATRLGYLELLKLLSDQGLIHWQPDKTNHAYLAELGTEPLRTAFREATRQFEYIWYGELRLTAALYQQVRTHQQAVARQVPAGRVVSAFNATAA